MSTLNKLRRIPILGGLYKSSILPRARIKYKRISELIQKDETILDIGCGNGGVLYLLRENGFKANGIDVNDHNFFSSNQTEIYDGNKLPFSDKSFDCGLLLTVLHHTRNPIAVLKEAARVCNELIIIEDIYTSAWNKYLMFFMDSLVNFEWKGHPHSNKSKSEWESIFQDCGYKIISSKENTILIVFKQITYHLAI
jgi:SAM-dependent methyltransferase